MSNSSFSFRVAENLKTEAFSVIAQYGFTPSQVFNLFLTEIAKTKAIPINLDYLTPNAKTIRAIKEVESGLAEKFYINPNANISEQLLEKARENNDDELQSK